MARRPFVRGGQRRATSWIDIPIQPVALGAGGAAITHTMTAIELAKRPITVIRTHLELLFQSDQLSATETQLGAVGLCVVSDQAAAIGITAVPTPDTDLASDLWFLNQILMNDISVNSAVGFDSMAGRLFSMDSKAMRKVNDDQQIVVVIELTGGSDGAIFTLGGRLLIKEH